MTTLRPLRDEALNILSAVIVAEWGERCPRQEAGCATCAAWAVFDVLAHMTDGSALDDPEEFARVSERFHLVPRPANGDHP